MSGRRDRCLLVLSQLLHLSYRDLAQPTAGRVTVAGGVASAADATGASTVVAAGNPVLCGPCAVSRSLRVLDVVKGKRSHRVLAEQVRDAEPVTDRSPHLCRSTGELRAQPRGAAARADRIAGYVPFPLQRLTPHSLSRRVHDMLAGDFGAHRSIKVYEVTEPEKPLMPAPVAAGVSSREDSRRAWERRRADLEDVATIDDVLAEVYACAVDLE